MVGLIDIPTELLLYIYQSLPTTHDALSLARVSSRFYDVFMHRGCQRNILVSITYQSSFQRVGLDFELKKSLKVLDRLWPRLFIRFGLKHLEEEQQHCRLIPVSLRDFLAQFSRRDGTVVELADQMAIMAAGYQKRLLERNRGTLSIAQENGTSSISSPATTTANDLKVARALHWCVMFYQLSEMYSRLCHNGLHNDDDRESFETLLDIHILEHYSRDRRPVALFRKTSPENTDDTNYSTNPTSIIYQTISSPLITFLQQVESDILSRTPETFPTILTVLCILCWAETELPDGSRMWPAPREEYCKLKRAVRDLFTLFYVSNKGYHPFTREWNANDYEEMVKTSTSLRSKRGQEGSGILQEEEERDSIRQIATSQMIALNKAWKRRTSGQKFRGSRFLVPTNDLDTDDESEDEQMNFEETEKTGDEFQDKSPGDDENQGRRDKSTKFIENQWENHYEFKGPFGFVLRAETVCHMICYALHDRNPRRLKMEVHKFQPWNGEIE